MSFSGLGMHLGNLPRLSDAQTRSISAENPTGEKGKGGMATSCPYGYCRELGQGWKVRPFIRIAAGETVTIADIDGPGAIQQIWMTPTGNWRFTIIRIYWDHQEQPSVECPIGDFFCAGWGTTKGARFRQLTSMAVCINPGSAFNCYWEMPFRKHCRITITNIEPPVPDKPEERGITFFYQINYTLTQVPDDAAHFHAQFRRVNPLPYKQVYTIVDGIQGQGHYVGTSMAWGVNNSGWWGEGEIKFYMDGDDAGGFPTICGTGTEDYFCGSYNFDVGQENGGYREFCTPYAGMHQVFRPDGLYQSQQRFGLYRWHIMDPIRFRQDLRVTIQALGWRSDRQRYLPLQDDIASVAFWYQTLPTAPFPALPDRDSLEVN